MNNKGLVLDSIGTTRVLGNIDGSKNSPTVVIFAGIHGNEIAGVKAAKIVLHLFRFRESGNK